MFVASNYVQILDELNKHFTSTKLIVVEGNIVLQTCPPLYVKVIMKKSREQLCVTQLRLSHEMVESLTPSGV